MVMACRQSRKRNSMKGGGFISKCLITCEVQRAPFWVRVSRARSPVARQFRWAVRRGPAMDNQNYVTFRLEKARKKQDHKTLLYHRVDPTL